MKKAATPRLFDELKSSMQEGIAAYEKPGALRRTTLEVPDPPPAFSAERIREIRSELAISQAVLAGILGTSLKALQAWEQGERSPLGPARRMLQLLSSSPEVAAAIMESSRRSRRGARRAPVSKPAQRSRARQSSGKRSS